MDAAGGRRPCDVIIRGEKIAEIAPAGAVNADGAEEIACCGKTLLPGLVDLHVHFREPGFEYKETVEGGCQAAVAGGFTTVCPMPNLNPAPDSPEHLAVELQAIHKAEEKIGIDVRPYATITLGRRGDKCVDFTAIEKYSAEDGIPLAGFSDDGSGIQEAAPMEEALAASAKEEFMVAAHCEVNSLLRGGCIHDGEWARAHGLKGICSESEYAEVDRDIRLAEQTGGHIHICHISTKESVSLIREAKKRGVHVTCETAPHYLAFCDEDLQDDGCFKMNPPIRSRIDREALREGLVDGTIDAIATDHAPHSAEEKSRGIEKSAMGIVGLETSFAAVYTYMVASGLMPMGRLVEAMSLTPRKLLGMDGDASGEIREGSIADLTLVDLEMERKVDSTTFSGKGRCTPFDGMLLKGKVCLTIGKGRILHRNL